jgi:hypothetical protein
MNGRELTPDMKDDFKNTRGSIENHKSIKKQGTKTSTACGRIEARFQILLDVIHRLQNRA